MRQKKLVDQLPMEFMLPSTSWVTPSSLPDMRGEGDLAIDLETRDDGLANNRGPGWATGAGHVTGIVITSSMRSVYCPVRHPDTQCFDHETAGRWLADHTRSPGRKFFQNAPYDLGWMGTEWGISPPDDPHDTQAMAVMLDENRMRYNLDAICEWQGVPGKDESMLRQAAEAFGFDPKREMWRLPARYTAPYAMQDGTATLAVAHKMLPLLERDGLMDAYQLEADLIPLTVAMRRRGVRVNTDRAMQVQRSLLDKSRSALLKLEDHIQIGRSITIDDLRSPIWMARVFSDLKIPYPQTAKGNDSFSNEWMAREDAGVVPNLCARAQQMHEASTKFVGNYILGFSHMGRIHAEIHQYKSDDGGTRTTRFSYSEPPLQQMPSRDEEIAIDIRGCFEPEEGEVWAAVDYSQQEYRLIVHFAAVCRQVGVERAVELYRNNPDTDFHQLVVDWTGLPRRRAKDCNFAKAFGAGVPKFALMIMKPLEEARAIMETYDEELPFVRGLGEFCQRRADSRGYIKMIDGARGRFDTWEPRWLNWRDVRSKMDELRAQGKPTPLLNPCSLDEAQARRADPDHPWHDQRLKRAKTHKSMNMLIQGSAARQMKKAMRECHREKIVPLLQMHDELDISVRDRKTAERVAEIMRTVVRLEIPVQCDIDYGRTWGLAAKDARTGHLPTWESAVG